MNPSIETILRQNYTDGFYITHTSMIEPTGKYQFSRQVLEEFWGHYCQEILMGNYHYGLTEKPQQYIPVLADVDLKVDVETYEEEHLYSKATVEKVISVYQEVIREIVEDVSEQNLICVLLEKPSYKKTTTKTYLKNGFHLHFPEIFLDKADQEVHLIPRVIQKIKFMKLFEYLGIEDSGTVIDKQCCGNTWLLYGSKKEDGANPYLFSRVYDYQCKEILMDDAFKHYLIYDNHGRTVNTL